MQRRNHRKSLEKNCRMSRKRRSGWMLWAVIEILLLAGMVPVQAAQVDLGGFEITVGEGSSRPTPTAGAGTGESTVRPTAKPTVKPTARPTAKPTVESTDRPTAKSTVKPTSSPAEKSAASSTAKSAAESLDGSAAQTSEESSAGSSAASMQEESGETASTLTEKPGEEGEKNSVLESLKEKNADAETENAGGADGESTDGAAGGSVDVEDTVESSAFIHSRELVQPEDFLPEIRVAGSKALFVLSFQIKGEEVLWRWEGNLLIPESGRLTVGMNQVCLLLLEETGKLWAMEDWEFFVLRPAL